ncbi:pentapeptide repeat-containing protein [Phormidium sp. FACHB-1136]|uniref:nSTAND1 domain-containing NTPase n=1 Tax=Phormidium sp. FACHB-1136 TaxID=2692848 RepID=UPI0016833FE8|nr:pentapeptide repeat-containing protein [Phormidium sp. FACHB-1136]MBD2427041.1 pentapeptide repeat-containing protein [Phormidium sp. FACHB-1136]
MAGLNRLQLVNALNRLAAPDFEKLLFAIKPPSGLVPGPSAPQASRVMALLEWVESPTGPGIDSIPPLLDDLDTLPEPPPLPDPADPTPLELGPNPYQGLRAFEEDDQDRFFGRDRLVEDLLQRFEHLYTDPHTIRILPIYGPSGSGKSSLARAGLIPALRKRPLPGKDSPRILTLKPGNHPLEVLATALARLANPDDLSIAKIREFQDELLRSDSKQAFDGLRFITDRLLENDPKAYLILLVDQFEEIYTLCEDPQERHAFICNLRGATSDPSQRVAVILTMRSDFLSATQQHPRFNQLFADPGRLVPVMQPEELEQAIIQPAKLALAKLDRPTRDRVNLLLNKPLVQILVKDAMGQEGALPLLQFLLTQMWEEMRQGIEPIETFNRVGGIGGALANEAKKIYENLSEADQKIARSIFLRLIKVNDDKTATRRRVPLSELVTKDQNATQVKGIINQFTRPGVWILITFANEEQIEMVEVAHEALIHNWTELRDWLADQWELLRKRDKIEQAAQEWESHQRCNDYLLQGKALRDAKEFFNLNHANCGIHLSKTSSDLIESSRKNKHIKTIKTVLIFLIIPFIGTLTILHMLILNHAQALINKTECEQDSQIAFLIRYKILMKDVNNLEKGNFCREELVSFDFSDLILWEADFRDSVLSSANFEGAFLVGAKFQGSNLENAKFNFALLEDAEFQNAYLHNTDFKNAQGLTSGQFDQAFLCRTKLPTELGLDSDRNCK